MKKTQVIFHPSTELYGADRIMVLAAKANADFETVIFVPKDGPLLDFIRENLPKADVIIAPEMPVIQRSLFSVKGIATTLKNMRIFSSLIRDAVPDHEGVMYYVNTLACSFVLPLLRRKKGKVLTHVHEIIDNPAIVAKATAKLALRYSDKVICVSQAVANGILKRTKDSNNKIEVLHNGILPIECDHQSHQDLNFYLFGRMKPEKGQWYLIEALSQIPKAQLKGAQFHLVGGPVQGKEEMLDDLKKRIQENRLNDIVHLHGFTNDITGHMAQADVCLIPSLMKDPFPTTVLEAMSAKKVVITTNHGGAKEAIVDQESGFLIDPDNPKQFAKAILNCIHEQNNLQQIGQNAKNRYEQLFTQEHFFDKWKVMTSDLLFPIWENQTQIQTVRTAK